MNWFKDSIKHLLIKPLICTTDVRATHNRFVWLSNGKGVYTLSLLGVLNGAMDALNKPRIKIKIDGNSY